MQLTVTPKVASSSAMVLVKPAIPCFADTYATLKGEATSECAEAVEMMRPHLRAFMPGTAARVAWKADERLMAMIWSHFSIGNSSIGATYWMPALLTRMSTDPNVVSAVLIMAAISAGLVMSAGEYIALTPNSFSIPARSFSISAGVPKPLMVTLAPSCAKARAIARPMPEVDPVTTAFFPFSMIRPIRFGDSGLTGLATDAAADVAPQHLCPNAKAFKDGAPRCDRSQ